MDQEQEQPKYLPQQEEQRGDEMVIVVVVVAYLVVDDQQHIFLIIGLGLGSFVILIAALLQYPLLPYIVDIRHERR